MDTRNIKGMTAEHIHRYGEIYAAAFNGEPWHDHWQPENAEIHVRELMEQRQSYGIEYAVDGEVAGFLLGTSMLFSYGRTFEINDLCVHPDYQGHGIGTELLEHCIADMKKQGMAGINLITASKGALHAFYRRHGFNSPQEVMLMGRNL